MNKKQYNNVIEHTLKHEVSAQTEDSLEVARAIFNNMGVALPQGDMKHVYEVIQSDDYMGWKSCTMQEAQEAANNGTAAIGISEDRIVVLAANDEEEPVAETTAVMSLSENTSAYAVDGLSYATYTQPTINREYYGFGGLYREVKDTEVNCFEYALLYDKDEGLNLWFTPLDPEYKSEYFIGRIINLIKSKGFECRQIDSYDSKLRHMEYRIAARIPNDDRYNYHFIYQLSDGTWAGKDLDFPSEHFGKGNPSNSPEMWNRDAYSPEAGTIYFAVRPEL